MTETHYDVLDVNPDATEKEIKRAYQQKKQEHQSDQSDGPDAHKTDMRIRAAKETLLDSQARQRYDQVHDIQTGSGDSSDETDRRTDRALIKLILDSVDRLRSAPERTKRWATVHRPHATDVSAVVRSPTVVRLAVTVVLSLVVVWTIRINNMVSPATEFGVVVASLCTSYVGYSLLSPLPFEKPHQAQFTPTTVTIWPVMLFVLGVGLLWSSALTGTVSGGVHYAFIAVLYAFIVCIGGLILGVPAGILLGRAVPLGITRPFREVQSGIALGLLGSATVLFTSVGGGNTLTAFIKMIGSNQGTPWLPTLRAGPLYLGSLLNFGLAVGMLLFLAVGIVGALWVLTAVPWQDRYEHGYRVRPTVWNLLAIGPVVIVVWMWVRGVAVLSLPIGPSTVELLRSDVTGGSVIVLTPLVGIYLLRRRLEPLLQQE